MPFKNKQSLMNIEIIAGSPRNPSLNLRVAEYLNTYLQTRTKDNIGILKLQEIQLPFIQKVWSCVIDVPEQFKSMAERMFAADAFIICSPEYNGSYSPAMKNLFDHFPKQRRKAFGIVTSSDGGMGGMRAAQQILQLVPALFGFASPNLLIVPKANEKFDEQNNLLDERFQKNINDFITEFLWLAHQLKK